MKIILYAALTLFGLVVKAQTITDTREYGSWVHARGEGSYSHFKPGLTVSPSNQNKMQSILQVFIDAYPKPYKESVCYGVKGITKGTGNKSIAYNIHLGDYGFTYDDAGKVKAINPGSQLGDMYEGYGNIYVNAIPEGARTTISSEQGLKLLNKLSYYSNTQQTNTKERPNGKVFAVGPQNNFAEVLKNLDADIKNYNLSKPKVPIAKFGNEADNYFTIRRLTATVKREDKTVSYVMSNFVVVSLKNQLPLIPVTRNEFLHLLEDNLNEEAQVEKDRYDKYLSKNSDKEAEAKMFNENNKKRKTKYNVINLIREVFKNELDKPAIIGSNQFGLTDVGFYHIFNVKTVPTANEVNDVFLNDKNTGCALYRMDNNFYKGLKDDDVKTIAFEWEEKLLNLPITENFTDANYIDKASGKLLTEVKFGRAIQHKLDWAKLASLLTK